MCRSNSSTRRYNPWISRSANGFRLAAAEWAGAFTARVAVAALCLALLLGGVRVARAQSGATTYSSTQRIFKVGILLIDSTATGDMKGDENPDPYVFYIADQRTDLKPQGWSFVNPLAPASVTAAIKSRWDARMGNGNSNSNASGYTIGQKVSPNMACYWEVPLTGTPISELLQYDMLFITNHRPTAFTSIDREKMRKLVDAGGVVWMEDCGGMTIGIDANGNSGPFLLDQVQFEGNTFGNFTTSGPVLYHPNHPILNTPYQLTLAEISNLGDKNYGNYHIASLVSGKTGSTGQANTYEAMPNPETLEDIVGNFGAPTDANGSGQFLPYIAAGYYGSGTVLLTSGDTGCDINDYCGGSSSGSGGNSGSYCGTNLQTAHEEDLKFLYNVVNWGSANVTYRRNDRRTAESFEEIGAPLLTSFNFASLFRTADRVNSKTAPLLSNGILYVSGVDSGGNVTLRAYDANPFSDYDGDGNYDEGLQDVSLGLPYDEIWRYTGSSAPSSGGGSQQYENPSAPVLATIQQSSVTVLSAKIPLDYLFMSGPDGTLYVFQALPNYGLGSIKSAPVLVTSVASDGGGTYSLGATHGVSPAPVVYGNVVYQVEPDGEVRAISVAPGSVGLKLWTSFSGTPPYTIVPTATPTVGFSQMTANTPLSNYSEKNTNDLMLYVPAEVTPQGATTPTGQILAYWLGTRNEVQHFLPNADGNAGYMDARTAGGGGTTLAGSLNVAPDATLVAGSPYITPQVRVYSQTSASDGGTTETTQYNYEKGYVSDSYIGSFEVVNGLYTGRIRIQAINGATAPGTAPNNQSNIWVSIDYDVLYIAGSTKYANPVTPANYAAVNPIGARVDQNLVIPNYQSKADAAAAGIPGGGTDTMAFSPDDLLLFSADQATAQWVTSVFALHEQMNASQLLWRFGLHSPGQADGSADGQTIVDYGPIFNYDQFLNPGGSGINYVQGSMAASLQSEPEYISNLSVIGSPITTNTGLTYLLATGTSTAATRSGNNTGINPYGLNQGVVTVLMAFQTNPTITLIVPIPFDATSPVQVSQVSSLDNTTEVSAAVANSNGSTQLTLDAPRGKITINNFNGTGGQFSASQSFVVTVTPSGQTTPVRFVVRPLPPSADAVSYINAGTQVGGATSSSGAINPDAGGFTPLQWYYVLPGLPMSSPTLSGDYIYFTMRPTVGGATSPGGNGPATVVAVDANPAANDPSIRVGFGEPIRNVVDTLIVPGPGGSAVTTTPSVNHVHWMSAMSDLSGTTTSVAGAYAPPVGAGGTLAVNTSIGTFAFANSQTVIADGTRLLEVSPDASATWALDSTQVTGTLGGDSPIYGVNNTVLNGYNGLLPTGRTTITSQTLAHPNVARKLETGDYLVADTGNNRVIRVTRAGTISWQLSSFADPYGILAGGDKLTLNGPTDIQYYVAPSPAVGSNPAGYEVHYLIADPGNFRIVEVADYFDSHGNQIDSPYAHTGNVATTHSVVWITRTQSKQGQRLSYVNIQRFLGVDPTHTYSGFPYVIATVGNSTVGSASTSGGVDTTGGALVSLNYAPYATNLPVNLLATGALTTTSLWAVGAAEPTGNGTILASANDLREATNGQSFGTAGSIAPTNGNNFTILKLTHPTYFTELNLPTPAGSALPLRTIYLICDSGTVYAVEATVDTNGAPVLDVLWKFTQTDYDVMNMGRLSTLTTGTILAAQLPKFVPSSVKLLQNGHFLITNSAYARCPLFQSGQFNGEVFQVNPTQNGGTISSGNVVTAPSGAFSLYTLTSSSTTAEGGLYDAFSVPEILSVVSSSSSPLFIQQMGAGSNTNLLEQPLFSDRP